VFAELKLIQIPEAYSVLGLCVVLDAYLLYVFFKKRKERRLVPADPVGFVSLAPPNVAPASAALEPPRRSV
jgi:hypothetical protein